MDGVWGGDDGLSVFFMGEKGEEGRRSGFELFRMEREKALACMNQNNCSNGEEMYQIPLPPKWTRMKKSCSVKKRK